MKTLRRAAALALVLCFCLGMAMAEENPTQIKGTLKAPIKLQKEYPDNPVTEGISPTTGLPAGDEAYTPILVILDGGAYPHWGIMDADIMFQVPNQGKGNTKLLALFADRYPEETGGVRSARASMVPIAAAWDAAFAYAGIAPVQGSNVNVDGLTLKWGLRKKGDPFKCFYLLGNNVNWRARKEEITAPGNLSCFIRNIHEELAAREDMTFAPRPFLFTDEPRTEGADASWIKIVHRGDSLSNPVSASSTSFFEYDEAQGGYLRYYSAGEDKNRTHELDADRYTGEAPVFANVLVIRVKFAWQNKYIYYKNHLVGSGCCEIFQNGRYVQGAWYRKDVNSRIVFVGPDGQELPMQRGKTFIVVANDASGVSYR